MKGNCRRHEQQAITLLVLCLVFLSFVQVVSAQPGDYKVLFDETRLHKRTDGGYVNRIFETEWYGGSDFANALRDKGFSISKTSTKPITYEKLKGYDVFIILSSDNDYSDSEIDAIESFVTNGGGLFLARDDWRGGTDDNYASNTIAKRFGVSFAKNGQICDASSHYGTKKKYRDCPKTTNIKSHAITVGISSFYFSSGTYIKDTGASKVLAYSDSDAWFDDLWDEYEGKWGNHVKDNDEKSGPFPVLSVMEYGKGRIVFIGDGGLFINSWLDKLADEKLGLNIVNWLIPRSDLTILRIYTEPNEPVENEDTKLNAVISNIGSRDAGDFKVKLYIDEVEKGYVDVDVLAAEDTQKWYWTKNFPSGEHAIKVIIDPNDVVDESDEDNNMKYKTIAVSMFIPWGIIGTIIAILIVSVIIIYDYNKKYGKKKKI